MDGKLNKSCLCSGIYCLDTIVVDGKVTLEEVGGTCGNVMCILAHLGLDTYPQASLDESPEGFKIKADLERYGCDTLFVTNTPDGGTTLLRVTHRRNPDGTPKISDIVKFSGENIPDASFADAFDDKLFIQTRGGEWKALPPVFNDHVVDTEGAGDWTTSAIIYGVARTGKRFADLDENDIVQILSAAQHYASESVAFMGPKGNIGG